MNWTNELKLLDFYSSRLLGLCSNLLIKNDVAEQQLTWFTVITHHVKCHKWHVIHLSLLTSDSSEPFIGTILMKTPKCTIIFSVKVRKHTLMPIMPH